MKISNDVSKGITDSINNIDKKTISSNKKGLIKNNDVSDLKNSSEINLSQNAQDIKKAKELAAPSKSIDNDKVAHFKKLIQEGKYKVNAEDIADKMVDEHLLMLS